VEATVFSKEDAVIMVGNFVDKPSISNISEWKKVTKKIYDSIPFSSSIVLFTEFRFLSDDRSTMYLLGISPGFTNTWSRS
jgi:hypothetical protein